MPNIVGLRKPLFVLLLVLLVLLTFPIKSFAATINLDTDFDTDGFTLHNGAAGGNGSDWGASVEVQSDGKYVIGGLSTNASSNSDIVVWRYNTNGTLDTTFNSTGYKVLSNIGGKATAADIGWASLTSDGKILIAGYTEGVATGYDVLICRLTSSGTLDVTFSTDGCDTQNSLAGGNSADYSQSDVVIQNDGKYVMAGSTTNALANTDIFVMRYNTDGTLDTTFNGTGYTTHAGAAGGTNGNDNARGIALQTDGKIIVTGYSRNAAGNDDIVVWRFNTNGSLDTTFDSDGYFVHNNAAGGNSHDYNIAIPDIQSDGKIVVSGYSRNVAGNDDIVVWRLNTDGSLDTTFSGDGIFTQGFSTAGNLNDRAEGLTVLNDGKILVTGYIKKTYTTADLILVRLTSAGALDTTFNGTGYVYYEHATHDDMGKQVVEISNGKYVVAGLFANTDLGIWVVLDYPHTDSIDSVSAHTQDFNLTGSVSAPKSNTNIGSVNWGGSTSGPWTSCTADDGTFNSTSEDYTCDLSSLADGSHTIYVESCNEHGACTYTSDMPSSTFVLDNVGPTGSVVINSGNTYTNSTSATLTISATDVNSDVTHMKVSEDSSFTGVSWESYSTSKSFTLSSGDGTKTVYVKFKDEASNESSTYSDTIILNSQIPGGTMGINNGDTYTGSTSVTLNMSATDDLTATENLDVIASESSSFTGASYVSFTSALSFTLSSGDGTKTVYVKFKDEAENESTVYSDTIILDTKSPSKTDSKVVLNSDNGEITGDGSGYTKDRKVKIYLDADQSVSKVEYMMVSTNKNFKNAKWRKYKKEFEYSLPDRDGMHHIYIKFKDSAGNVSDAVEKTIRLDREAPEVNLENISFIKYGEPKVYTNYFLSEDGVYFSGTSDDKTSVHVYLDEKEVSDISLSSAETKWKTSTLNLGSGKHDVLIYSKDKSGNKSKEISFTLTVDQSGESFPGELKSVLGMSDESSEVIKPTKDPPPMVAPSKPSGNSNVNIPVEVVDNSTSSKTTLWSRLGGLFR